MKKLACYFVILTLALLIIAIPSTNAQEKLTVAWAQWDPANYLTELSKDFTAETGIEVDVVQISWSHFQDKFSPHLSGKVTDTISLSAIANGSAGTPSADTTLT